MSEMVEINYALLKDIIRNVRMQDKKCQMTLTIPPFDAKMISSYHRYRH